MTQNNGKVRVRFAPSPTGYLHVGGARTAIFNWLYARKHQGDFLVRIEDTDRERSTPEMVDNILESMRWLGLEPDEPVVFQSRQSDSHEQAIRRLLEEDKAYRCFCSPEELEAKRLDAGGNQDAYQYDQTCRHLSGDEIAENLQQHKPFVIRFKTPERWISFKDRVYKKISVHTREIDDFIIRRRDGSPVYQLAVVVDDAAMGITHVIRGEDHLSNTPKQILLYQALGHDLPRFAHLPLILGSDGKRLSKRHGATSVAEYRHRGYLPTALFNYLALLGWTPKGNEEIFLPEEIVPQFEFTRVSKSSAVFDEQKLRWVNGFHFSRWAAADLLPLVEETFRKTGFASKATADRTYLKQVVDLLKSRVKMVEDFVEMGRYFWEDPEEYDGEAAAKYWPDSSVNALMQQWAARLESLEDFGEDSLEKALRDLADAEGVKAGRLIHPTRLALTGQGVSPGIFEVMALLGRETNLKRLRKAIEVLPG